MHKFNTSFVFHFYILSLGFESALQLKGWNLKALQNETHMRASILNTVKNRSARNYEGKCSLFLFLCFYHLEQNKCLTTWLVPSSRGTISQVQLHIQEFLLVLGVMSLLYYFLFVASSLSTVVGKFLILESILLNSNINRTYYVNNIIYTIFKN